MKLILPLLLLLCSHCFGQQILIQVNGWNAYVHLPGSYYDGTNRSYPTLVFFPGLGEVGTTATKVIVYGPNRHVLNGWNGITTIPGRTVEWILISLQPPTAFPTEFAMNTRLQTLKQQYRIEHANIFLTGLSHGGWCAMTFPTGDNYGGPYTYASQINAIVSVQGMVADDNAPWPTLFDNFAQVGGSMLNFENINDARGGDQACARMNATRPGSAVFVQTNLGNGYHCCFQTYYSQPFLIEGINQTMYEWLARKVRSVVALPVPNIPTPAGEPIFFNYNSGTITLNSDHRNVYTITNMLGQVVMKGAYSYGRTQIDISALRSGVYVLHSTKGIFKIIKY